MSRAFDKSNCSRAVSKRLTLQKKSQNISFAKYLTCDQLSEIIIISIFPRKGTHLSCSAYSHTLQTQAAGFTLDGTASRAAPDLENAQNTC